eukprot:3171038-Rhodomonas_salina.1
MAGTRNRCANPKLNTGSVFRTCNKCLEWPSHVTPCPRADNACVPRAGCQECQGWEDDEGRDWQGGELTMRDVTGVTVRMLSFCPWLVAWGTILLSSPPLSFKLKLACPGPDRLTVPADTCRCQ